MGGRHRKGQVDEVPAPGGAVPDAPGEETAGWARPETGRPAVRRAGPWDAEEAPDDGAARLDLSSVRVPMPTGAQLQCEPEPSGALRAVHVLVPEGRVTVSAFAAPRSAPLWPELAEELAASLSKDGATVRRDRGEWGRELVARNDEMTARVIGVDGPRWMLRGVGTGPAHTAKVLHTLLRDMVRGTVVVRGDDPLPVRTLLSLVLPETLPEPLAESVVPSLPTQPNQIVSPEVPQIPLQMRPNGPVGVVPPRSAPVAGE